ncbi:hypothetical protein BASA83_002130 [Batrachochytrium salamandrivorans]|nr:hypothetical protein BASA83_002130 [Batrachochytrium salamandrivorans]
MAYKYLSPRFMLWLFQMLCTRTQSLDFKRDASLVSASEDQQIYHSLPQCDEDNNQDDDEDDNEGDDDDDEDDDEDDDDEDDDEDDDDDDDRWR